jgi:hypothetical protein
MAIYFVDGATGDDTNTGRDNTGLALATATWTEATFTLTQAGAFASYTFTQGDLLYVSAGTGATVGLYEIASRVDDDSITLAETAQYPGVTNGSDLAAGDLATGDIESSDGPWVTIQKAADTLAAGDLVYVRASADYAEMVTEGTAGTSTSRIRYEGYTAIIGDGGRATIDGGGSRDKCFLLDTTCDFVDIVNFEMKNAISNGLDCASGVNNLLFQNILSHGNGGRGIICASGVLVVIGCEAYSNTTSGIYAPTSMCLNCYVHDEVVGFERLSSSPALISCVVDTCSSDGAVVLTNSAWISCCTFYNCGKGISYGASNSVQAVHGCVFDSNTTSLFASGAQNIAYIDYCIFNNNGTDVHSNISVQGRGSGNAAKGPNCMSADPGFVDAPNGNFTPTADAVREAAAFTFLGTNVSGVSRTFLWPGAVQPKPTPRRVPSIGMAGRR